MGQVSPRSLLSAEGGRRATYSSRARADSIPGIAQPKPAAQIDVEQGRVDLLINAVGGGHESLHAGRYDEFVPPFWQQDLSLWDDMFASGVRAHYVASALAVPLM